MMKRRALRPIHPNAGVCAEYDRRLKAMVNEMSASYLYWITAIYGERAPELAMDAEHWSRGMSPSKAIQEAMRRLAARWESRFAEFAPNQAAWFVGNTNQAVNTTMQAALREGGMSVKFQMSRYVQNMLKAEVGANVALIKTIQKQFHGQIEPMVLSSAAAGRDINQLTDALEATFQVTRKRAAFIAKDQNSKSTAIITKAKQLECGITEAIWLHSGGGKHPRPSHVAMNGKPYDVKTGIKLDDDPEIVWPGTAINCRCVSRALLPELAAFRREGMPDPGRTAS